MSSHTRIDVVPFVAHYVFCSRDTDKKHIHDPFICSEGYTDDFYPEDCIVNGWKSFVYETENIHPVDCPTKHKRIDGDQWQSVDNEKHNVWIVDESPYNSIGVHACAIVSDKKESIVIFCAAQGVEEYTIEETDAIQRTI